MCLMAIRQWTIVTRTKTEEMWRKSSFGYFLVIIAVGFAVLWYFRVPPPGYSVTAMGVAAGVMALRAEMSGREKWLWTLILFAFALVEIRAISHDRTVHDKEQAETRAHEAQSFSLIGTGIQQSIEESQRHSTLQCRGLRELSAIQNPGQFSHSKVLIRFPPHEA